MIVYVVYCKNYKLKQGQLVDVLVERRKDLRGQTPLESGLKWAKVALGCSLEKERSIFVVPKKLELGADPEVLLGERILSTEMPANILSVHGSSLQALPSAGALAIAQGRQNDLPLDGIRPQFMVP